MNVNVLDSGGGDGADMPLTMLRAALAASAALAAEPDGSERMWRVPSFRWSQRSDSVSISVDVPGASVEHAHLGAHELDLRLHDRRQLSYSLQVRTHSPLLALSAPPTKHARPTRSCGCMARST